MSNFVMIIKSKILMRRNV